MEAIPEMLVTVAICTRNRADSLKRTLQSLVRMDKVACEWEVLVVDNGSTDATQAVIASFADLLPVRSVVEPKAGAANARNRSALEARGRYMVCTDDDTVVGVSWLADYVRAFERWPDASLFGGHIVPVLEEPVTPWFRDVMPLLWGPLAIRDLGSEPLRFAPDNVHLPYGANYAVRTEVQRRFPFDTRRGPGAPYLGEETASFNEMLSSGVEGRWVPEARVEHMIAARRQTRAYVAYWYEMLGKTAAWDGEPLHGPLLFGAPRWLWKRMLVRTADYGLARLHATPRVWTTKLIALALDRGRLRYLRSAAGRAR